MAQCASKGGPELRAIAALKISEDVERAGVKGEHRHREHECENQIEEQVQVRRNRDEEPRDEEREQNGVGEKLNEPETAAAEAVRECATGGFETRHYFTSTTAASLVAMMDGWYIG
jgi:hypothetical protein